MTLTVQIQKLSDDLEDVVYAHEGDAGFDLRANEETVIAPDGRQMVATGICMAIPEGYVGLIWDRSGLAAKKGIHVLAGVVDSGYRGEVKVVLKNLGDVALEITRNMRIAQMLIQPVACAQLVHVESLDDTSRGEGGFGSTGHK